MSAHPVLADIAPADVTAEQLGLRLNGPAPDSLAELTLTHPRRTDSRLHLAVIGASHVITATDGEVNFREEISCTARAAGQNLPEELSQAGYHLRTRTLRLPEPDFLARGEEILARTGEPGFLAVTFPGAGRLHLTALTGAATDVGWDWRTWHLYPADGAIVETRSRWSR